MPSAIWEEAAKHRLQAGMAAKHADGFAQWLQRRQYKPLTIREKLEMLARWTKWARKNGYGLDTIREAHAASVALIKAGYHPRFRGDLIKRAVETAKLFISYLEDHGVQARLPSKPVAPIVAEFTAWAREQHGLAETTLTKYLWTVTRFVEALGDDPTVYDAATIRAFVMDSSAGVSVGRMQSIVVDIRSFLRFLVSTGRCKRGLDYVLPKIARSRRTPIPRFLPEADIVRLLAACEGEDRLRDRAIILLLARLGLRASEVAGLTLEDIDWQQGTIRVFRKGRREELLPLSQELGDALITYIEHTRPKLAVRLVFLTEIAPLRAIDRGTVKSLVRRALMRAGVESACRGAHLLRHSAATAMLRHGVSLAQVGNVLGHRSTNTTPHYARVDMTLLSSITQPWPGEMSC
jgi:integrase/recombinase XerD